MIDLTDCSSDRSLGDCDSDATHALQESMQQKAPSK